MNTIKFSFNYKKLQLADGKVPTFIRLLQVIEIDLENMTESFIEYDTEGIFNLPKKGKYLMLIFLKKQEGIFTTIRRSTPEKKEYYSRNQGADFILNITEDY